MMASISYRKKQQTRKQTSVNNPHLQGSIMHDQSCTYFWSTVKARDFPCKNLTEILAISQSRRDYNEISLISPRSRRDLCDNTNLRCRDLVNLGEISPISLRLPRSRRDLGEIFARVIFRGHEAGLLHAYWVIISCGLCFCRCPW